MVVERRRSIAACPLLCACFSKPESLWRRSQESFLDCDQVRSPCVGGRYVGSPSAWPPVVEVTQILGPSEECARTMRGHSEATGLCVAAEAVDRFHGVAMDRVAFLLLQDK
jgi:hypothetical protein